MQISEHKNSQEARLMLQNMLNDNCLDPFPGTRTGNQFLSETDGINLTRANTFPKGFIFTAEEIPHQVNRFHTSGWALNTQRFLINYFIKDMISYTDTTTNIKYMDKEYAIFMKEQILYTLQNNIALEHGYYIKEIGQVNEINEYQGIKLPFKIYEIIIPVTIKWVNSFG